MSRKNRFKIAQFNIPVKLQSCLIFALFIYSTTTFFTSQSASAFTIIKGASVGLRTYPFSASGDAHAKFERLVWDKRAESGTEWKFGLLQGRIGVATHGLFDIGVAFYPISILEFAFSSSKTYRFYETKPFDCDFFACKGELNRSSQSARLLLGHRLKDFDVFFIPSFALTQIHHTGKDSERAFAIDEVEKLILDSNGDKLIAQSLLMGLKKGDFTYAFLARDAQYDFNKSSNQMFYFIVRKDLEKMRLQGGLGQYGSDYQAKQFSAVLSASWNFDDKSQSLF